MTQDHPDWGPKAGVGGESAVERQSASEASRGQPLHKDSLEELIRRVHDLEVASASWGGEAQGLEHKIFLAARANTFKRGYAELKARAAKLPCHEVERQQWRPDCPQAEGYYWCRNTKAVVQVAEVVSTAIAGRFVARFTNGTWWDFENLSGVLWAGPISEPPSVGNATCIKREDFGHGPGSLKEAT